MKRLLVVLAAGLLGQSLWAAEPGEKKARWLGQVELWTKDDAFGEYQTALEESVNSDTFFFDSVSGSFENSGGVGFRGGVFFPMSSPGLEIGGSLGYVRGPEGEIKETVQDGFYGAGSLTETIQSDYVRALFEVQKRLMMGEKGGIKLRVGVGVGQVDLEGELKGTGFIAASESYSGSAVGLTWEVFPSLFVSGGSVDWELGVGYAQFPKFPEDDNFLNVKWNPVGLRFTAAF